MNKWIIGIIMMAAGASAVKTADYFLNKPTPQATTIQTTGSTLPQTADTGSNSLPTSAENTPLPPKQNADTDEIRQVFDTAITHAKTAQCSVEPFDENNFRNNVFLISNTGEDDFVFRTYGVLYQSDPKCADGSGTAKYSLAEAEVSSQGGGHIRVSNPDLFAKPNNTETGSFAFNDRFIRKADIDSKGVLTIEYNEYAETDGNCCTSERWETHINPNTMTQLDKRFLRKENPYAEN
ncbi:hypothetical protein [Eikenella corrodens]|uniref:Lipoprotein n=1 Tax=Eikenella corrodens TaxID=539 RepID=A0A3S9SKC9_EIKCO|nr:hypothetical protein [Eikenella corrodens]AZR59995.1 hypothetical protein ELB75_08135 [Eikenella corrodens]